MEFDGTASVIGQNIKTGMADIDPLLTGRTEIEWDGARTAYSIEIRNASVNGQALTAQVQATVDDPTGDLSADGNAQLKVPNLSLFSGLAGRDLAGSIEAKVIGNGTLSSRNFDVQSNLNAIGIRTGIDTVDKLIQGQTTLSVDAQNGEDGLNIQTFRLNGTAITASASGKLDRQSGGLDFSVKLDDLARVLNTMSGPLTLEGNVAPTSSGLEGTVNLNGPDSSYAKLAGTVDSNGSADLDFDAQIQSDRTICARISRNCFRQWQCQTQQRRLDD